MGWDRSYRVSLSLAGTAALALVSLPFAIRPAVAQEAPAAAAEPKPETTEAIPDRRRRLVAPSNLKNAIRSSFRR